MLLGTSAVTMLESAWRGRGVMRAGQVEAQLKQVKIFNATISFT